MPMMREFAGLDGGEDVMPDETTILKFRHMLDKHHLVGDFISQPDAEGNIVTINDIYLKTLSFAWRTESLKKLAEALRILIELERQVYKSNQVN